MLPTAPQIIGKNGVKVWLKSQGWQVREGQAGSRGLLLLSPTQPGTHTAAPCSPSLSVTGAVLRLPHSIPRAAGGSLFPAPAQSLCVSSTDHGAPVVEAAVWTARLGRKQQQGEASPLPVPVPCWPVVGVRKGICGLPFLVEPGSPQPKQGRSSYATPNLHPLPSGTQGLAHPPQLL